MVDRGSYRKNMSDEPRRHHYLFAHHTLPSYALESGDQLVAAGRTGQLRPREVWADLAKTLPEHERLDGNGLEATYHRLGAYQAVLVRMPLAKRPGEAHFALIVVGPGRQVHPAAAGRTRYLTLECAVSPGGRKHTVVGEWTTERHVILHGEGPPVDAKAFLAAASLLIGAKTPRRLTRLLRRRGRPRVLA
jgi:hypothetical protein